MHLGEEIRLDFETLLILPLEDGGMVPGLVLHAGNGDFAIGVGTVRGGSGGGIGGGGMLKSTFEMITLELLSMSLIHGRDVFVG
jgi:hypothetical protein